MSIQLGASAPDFELASNEAGADGKPGKTYRLSDFRGKRHVLLAFYPLDFSPTCTKEHACFVDDLASLEAAGTQLFGLSVDSKWAHAAYAKEMKIRYPLLADFQPRGEVAAKFGLYVPDRGHSKRATVIVDKAGKIASFVEHEGQRDNRAILEVIRALG